MAEDEEPSEDPKARQRVKRLPNRYASQVSSKRNPAARLSGYSIKNIHTKSNKEGSSNTEDTQDENIRREKNTAGDIDSKLNTVQEEPPETMQQKKMHESNEETQATPILK